MFVISLSLSAIRFIFMFTIFSFLKVSVVFDISVVSFSCPEGLWFSFFHLFLLEVEEAMHKAFPDSVRSF